MASETKWTPGPWMAVQKGTPTYHFESLKRALGQSRDLDRGGFRIEQAPVGAVIAKTYGGLSDQEPANAHLLAAAPALYEALEGLLTGHPSGDSAAQKIGRAALAKARGES